MKYSDWALNILTAISFKGIGKAWIASNLNKIIEEDEIVFLLNKKIKDFSKQHFLLKKDKIKTLLDNTEGVDGVIAIGEDNFNFCRGSIKNKSDMPVFLFYKGNLKLLNKKNQNIAVIGILEPEEDIIEIEKEVVREFVNNGSTIVSGLAIGCDTIAHREALDSGGDTIAILPSPITDIIPKKNIELAEEIVARGGLLVTEYLTSPKGKRDFIKRFVERDRLQAMFSDAVILSASYSEKDGRDSGSRHAMNKAKEYGIKRGVIYEESIAKNNPKFNLNREIINSDKNVIIINRENLKEGIEKIIINNKYITENKVSQKNLNL